MLHRQSLVITESMPEELHTGIQLALGVGTVLHWEIACQDDSLTGRCCHEAEEVRTRRA
jgi:hypothetical protein